MKIASWRESTLELLHFEILLRTFLRLNSVKCEFGQFCNWSQNFDQEYIRALSDLLLSPLTLSICYFVSSLTCLLLFCSKDALNSLLRGDETKQVCCQCFSIDQNKR